MPKKYGSTGKEWSLASFTGKGKCQLKIFLWGYPSNKLRERRKTMKASSS